MNNKTPLENLIENLHNNGVNIDQSAYVEHLNKQDGKTNFLKFIIIGASLLACGFFMVFLILAFKELLDHLSTFIFLGAGFLGGAYFLNLKSNQSLNTGISVALFITGAGLIYTGVAIHLDSPSLVSSTLIGVSLMTLALFRNDIVLLLSALTLYLGLYIFIGHNFGFKMLFILQLVLVSLTISLCQIGVMAWGFTSKIAYLYSSFYKATMLFCLGGAIVFRTDYFLQSTQDLTIYLDVLVYGLIALNIFSVFKLFEQSGLNKILFTITFVLITSVFIFLVSRTYPGFGISYLFLLWSFQNKDKFSLVLNAVFLLGTLGLYYYNLQSTLLNKSISLFVSGLLFMGLFVVFQKVYYGKKKN